MKKLLLVLVLLFVFFAPGIVRAQAITVTIVSPLATGRYPDTLNIRVSISSTFAMDTVKATVSSRSVLLVRNPSDGSFRGALILTGLAQGTQELDLYARDAMGNTQTATRNFTFDSRPIVTIQSPTNFTAYQTKLHIKATVSDPGHANCNGVIYTPYPLPTTPAYTITFVNSIDTLVDFLTPPTTSGQVDFAVRATDDAGQITESSLTVYGEKSPFLTPVYTDIGRIIDYLGNRVLVETGRTLKIVNITDNTSQTIATANREITSVHLTNSGAAMVMAPPGTTADSLYVWKSSTSTLTNINTVANRALNAYEFSVNGDNIVWYARTQELHLTNAGTLVDILVDANHALNNNNGIDSLGNISYSAAEDIYKYVIATQTKTRITTDGATNFNSYSSIEGNNIAYIHQVTSNPTHLYLYDGTKSRDLGISSAGAGSSGFQFRNGYLGYSKYDNNSISQIWLRRPDTSSRQVSFFSGPSTMDKIGNTGSLLFTNSAKRYYADSLTAPHVVSGTLGTSFYVNGAFYLALGNTLFKYNSLTAPTLAAAITSFTPVAAPKGATVRIRGSHFTGATGVSFGGVNATSFNIIGDTTITAVVGTGATGSVSVAGYSGAGSLAGFTFIAVPTISSFTPIASGTGATITINGTNFINVSAVSFGGTPATSFNMVSATQITAVVASGTTGSVSVTTPGGVVTKTGYTFLPLPVITTNTSSPSFLQGSSISLSASTGSGFTYQWALDGVDISNATQPILVANKGGSYTVRITSGAASVTSAPLLVTMIFDLPASNFQITGKDASCKGSTNGEILISATASMNYTAEVTGNGANTAYHFTATATSGNLGAGTYDVCITVDGQSDYKQCFTVVIGEPKDLSVFATVNGSDRTVTLSLDGGNVYTVNLNGANYTTTSNSLTLNLQRGDNLMTVSTDKLCQGIIVKHISAGNDITLYPNPIDNILNITLGQDPAKMALVEVRDLNGNLVFSGKYANQYGSIQVDLSSLTSGIHVLKLGLTNSESIFKIIKK